MTGKSNKSLNGLHHTNTAKRPYQKPRLEIYGSVRQMTKELNTENSADGGFLNILGILRTSGPIVP